MGMTLVAEETRMLPFDTMTPVFASSAMCCSRAYLAALATTPEVNSG